MIEMNAVAWYAIIVGIIILAVVFWPSSTPFHNPRDRLDTEKNDD